MLVRVVASGGVWGSFQSADAQLDFTNDLNTAKLVNDMTDVARKTLEGPRARCHWEDDTIPTLKDNLAAASTNLARNSICKTFFKRIRIVKANQHGNRILSQFDRHMFALHCAWRQTVEPTPPKQIYFLDQSGAPTTTAAEMTEVVEGYIAGVFAPVTDDHQLFHETLVGLIANLWIGLANDTVEEWNCPHGTIGNIVREFNANKAGGHDGAPPGLWNSMPPSSIHP